ncbi:MAG: CHASE domain-containing protein [Croceibacterium sp.]
MPVAIFSLIAAITIVSVFAIERGEAERNSADLRSRAMAIGSALERRANASSAYLRAGAAYLSSLPNVPAGDFRRFVSEMRLDTDYRGAEGIGWARVVRPAERAAFDQQLAEEYGGDLQIHPPAQGNQPYAVAILYLQPDSPRNRRALGLDMYAEEVRRTAMDEAERTARPTATGKVVLAQEGNGTGPGFLIYMPVFQQVGAGRKLTGFIYSPFNAKAFLTAALELEGASDLAVEVYDGRPGDGSLLAATGTPDADSNQTARRITIAGRDWYFRVHGTEPGGLSGLAIATLVFGLLVASLLALVLRLLTTQALEDETALKWFQEQASIRNSLTRELNHRVKNTLANVLSIIALTRRRAHSLEDFADGLDGRIRALSATHDLLTQSDWGSTPVQAVVQAELRPYSHDADHVVELLGPDVQLAPNDALSLGLAIHELATNAAKYGALSRPGGRVTVDWKLVSDALVRIEWLERGGPPVPPNRGRGFGTDLIERIVAHELKNPVKLEFEPEGVRCVLTIPVRKPGEFAMRAPQKSA